MTRRAAKVDRNQAEIVGALRAVGASVEPLHTVGKGCPDLLVGFRGQNWLIEVKDGLAPNSAQKLNDRQVVWHRDWRGQAVVVNNAEDAIRAIGVESYLDVRARVEAAIARGDSDNLRTVRGQR